MSTVISSKNMATIPNEVLILILAELKQIGSGSEELKSAALVCRKWSLAAREALWHDLFVTSDSFDTVKQWLRKPVIAAAVRSITVYGNIVRLKDFTNVLPELARLRSCSLDINANQYVREDRADLPSNVQLLDGMLRSLPSSIEDLELKIAGVDNSITKDDTCHICVTLSGLLQQVKHVRLSRGITCPVILPTEKAETSKLTSLIVDLRPLSNAVACPGAFSSGAKDGRSETLSKLRERYDANVFPDLESFRAFDIVSGNDQEAHSAYIEADILSNQMTLHPAYLVPARPRSMDMLRYRSWRDGSEHEVYGRVWKTYDLIEDSWVETIEGYRFSQEYSGSQAARERNYEYRPVEYEEGREYYLEKYVVTPYLWYREKQEGIWLLAPKTIEGLDVQSVEKIKPEPSAATGVIDGARWLLELVQNFRS